MNWPQHAEIRGRSFIIIALSYDDSPKVVFILHSGFSDSNLPRVCLENLSETPPRGQKRVVGMISRGDYHGLLQQTQGIIRIFNFISIFVLFK